MNSGFVYENSEATSYTETHGLFSLLKRTPYVNLRNERFIDTPYDIWLQNKTENQIKNNEVKNDVWSEVVNSISQQLDSSQSIQAILLKRSTNEMIFTLLVNSYAKFIELYFNTTKLSNQFIKAVNEIQKNTEYVEADDVVKCSLIF